MKDCYIMNKTKYYNHIRIIGGVAAVAKGKKIPVEIIRDCELQCLDLTEWEIF